MPQTITTTPATSVDVLRRRAIIQHLRDTPDLQGLAATPLAWDDYTDVLPPTESGDAVVSTLAIITSVEAAKGIAMACTPSYVYRLQLRISVAMANALAAEEMVLDLVRIVEDRLNESPPMLNIGGELERFRFEVPPQSPRWVLSSDRKQAPGGKVTAIKSYSAVGPTA